MLVSRLLQTLLRFFMPGIVPDDGGGAASAAEPAAPAAEPEAAPAPDAGAAPAELAAAAPAEPADPMAGLDAALDAVSEKPGQPRVQGKFAAPSQRAAGIAATPAPTPAPTAAPAATPAPTAAPKPGEVDLTPPEGMTPRATERWQQLTERAKQVPVLEQRAQEATTALESVRQMVSGSGLNAQEFAGLLEFGRLTKASTPQEMHEAMRRLDVLRADLATRMGVEVPGIDPLAAHADLKADVENMLMTRERAVEIATLRTQHQRRQQADNMTAQGQREFAQHQQAVENASARMAQTLAQRAGTPGHDAKLQYIAGYFKDPARMQAFVNTYQPQQWEAALLMMYDTYVAPAPAQPASPQPLRPGAFAAGNPVRTGHATAETAVSGAFARLGI
jgi:hypothetical protein